MKKADKIRKWRQTRSRILGILLVLSICASYQLSSLRNYPSPMIFLSKTHKTSMVFPYSMN